MSVFQTRITIWIYLCPTRNIAQNARIRMQLVALFLNVLLEHICNRFRIFAAKHQNFVVRIWTAVAEWQNNEHSSFSPSKNIEDKSVDAWIIFHLSLLDLYIHWGLVGIELNSLSPNLGKAKFWCLIIIKIHWFSQSASCRYALICWEIVLRIPMILYIYLRIICMKLATEWKLHGVSTYLPNLEALCSKHIQNTFGQPPQTLAW